MTAPHKGPNNKDEKPSIAPSRIRHDMQMKRETVRKILAGELTLEDACKQHGVQTYQMQAWIGQIQLEDAQRKRYEAHDDTGTIHTAAVQAALESERTGERPSLDVTRRIVEWYIEKFVLGTKDRS